jgi:hypothetical protein
LRKLHLGGLGLVGLRLGEPGLGGLFPGGLGLIGLFLRGFLLGCFRGLRLCRLCLRSLGQREPVRRLGRGAVRIGPWRRIGLGGGFGASSLVISMRGAAKAAISIGASLAAAKGFGVASAAAVWMAGCAGRASARAGGSAGLGVELSVAGAKVGRAIGAGAGGGVGPADSSCICGWPGAKRSSNTTCRVRTGRVIGAGSREAMRSLMPGRAQRPAPAPSAQAPATPANKMRRPPWRGLGGSRGASADGTA